MHVKWVRWTNWFNQINYQLICQMCRQNVIWWVLDGRLSWWSLRQWLGANWTWFWNNNIVKCMIKAWQHFQNSHCPMGNIYLPPCKFLLPRLIGLMELLKLGNCSQTVVFYIVAQHYNVTGCFNSMAADHPKRARGHPRGTSQYNDWLV